MHTRPRSCPLAVRLVGGLLGLLLIGCSTNNDRLAVRPIQGKVLLGKQPTTGAMIVFHPLDKKDARAVPRGKVDQDGNFKLSTYDADDGAPVGKYKVTIDWRKTNTLDPNDNGISLVPAKYTRPDTTPLEIEITAATDVLEPFVLAQ